MNWYIGQDIVAVMDHSQGRFKRGDEFKIRGLRVAPCGCGHIQIDIGLSDSSVVSTECTRCWRKAKYTGALFYHEVCFAPLDPIKEAISNLIEETLTVKQI